MTSGRRARVGRPAVLLAVLSVLAAAPACGAEDDAPADAADAGRAETAVADLEPLVVDDVPSGLPRLPDDEIEPPAGPKRVEDVAGYADDPVRERDVLRDYGYLHGWERFWGADGGPQTGVSVDRFADADGAAAYAEDLARNEADHYGGMLSEGPPDLPPGCRRLLVDEPDPEDGLTGPPPSPGAPEVSSACGPARSPDPSRTRRRRSAGW
ncbi:hypothetical protein [Blastococcus sp. CCUG 61487]|uniref:hypothetical protein n=1 Tax=Blastococcus sp. CCUG 61487 TaxID=1840703 RepID=UPI0010C0453C|nr:hypothetical protein [Blastococcus sp. CCUG 61487]